MHHLQEHRPIAGWEAISHTSWINGQESGGVREYRGETLLVSRFADGGGALNTADRDAQDNPQTAHHEAL